MKYHIQKNYIIKNKNVFTKRDKTNFYFPRPTHITLFTKQELWTRQRRIIKLNKIKVAAKLKRPCKQDGRKC